jgi:hypothetical protein
MPDFTCRILLRFFNTYLGHGLAVVPPCSSRCTSTPRSPAVPRSQPPQRSSAPDADSILGLPAIPAERFARCSYVIYDRSRTRSLREEDDAKMSSCVLPVCFQNVRVSIVLVMIFKKGAACEKRPEGSLPQFRWYPPYAIICSRQQLKG